MKKTVSRPGRTVQEDEKYPIPVSGLKIGMYVCELDRPWLETPFILQGFRIESIEQIDTISGLCDYVYVSDRRDRWEPADERSILEPPVPKRTYQNQPLGEQEIHRAGETHRAAKSLTRDFLDDARLGRAIDIQQVKNTVSECVQSVIRNPNALLWMGKIRKKDEYTAEHCLNVGLLAVSFGRHLGKNEEELNLLGLCGILHDVGKMRTPLDVLNKEGKFSPEEYNLMKLHAQHGRDILMSHKEVHHAAVDVCYGHHEALDGTGYPRGIKEGGISEITRIVTICDVYDAITSERVYKKGQSSLEAMKVLYQNRSTRFDAQLVTEFIECMGLYPPGSIVDLKTGEAGIVISTNYRHRHLPKVLVVRDDKKMPRPDKVINLQQLADRGDHGSVINTVKPNGTYGIRIELYIQKGLMID